MSFLSSFRLPVLLCAGVLLTGAMTRQTTPARTSLPAPAADPAATQALEQAIAALAPARLPWVRTRLWQRVDHPAPAFEGEGTYLAGPGQRFRLDLKVHSAQGVGRSLTLSNGITFWEIRQVATDPPQVSKVALDELVASPGNPELATQLRNEFFDAHVFPGLAPLLARLRAQFTFTRHEAGRWQGKDVLRLIGVARKPEKETPFRCRLYLDARTCWPHRIEWWGAGADGATDALWMQLNLGEPDLRSASDSEFTFHPGQTPVTDCTLKWLTASLKRRQSEPSLR
jgi:hypothetical protein